MVRSSGIPFLWAAASAVALGLAACEPASTSSTPPSTEADTGAGESGGTDVDGSSGGAVSDAVVVTPDAAVVTPDAAVVAPDASVIVPDAAVVVPDAAVVVPDAAEVAPDAAVVTPDAAVVTPDAAVVTPDAAVVVPDAAAPPPPVACEGVLGFPGLPALPVGGGPIAVVAGDLDHDNDVDLVSLTGGFYPTASAPSYHIVAVNRNLGDGTFAPLEPYGPLGGYPATPTALALADLNHDGHLDLAMTLAGNGFEPGHLGVMLGHGDGTFDAQPTEFECGSQPVALATGDVDGDGWPDVVVGTQAGFINVFLNRRDDTFSRADYATPSAVSGVVVSDLDGDGLGDVATTDDADLVTFAWQVSVFRNTGDGTLAPPLNTPMPDATWGLAVADMDGQNGPDIVVAARPDYQVMWNRGAAAWGAVDSPFTFEPRAGGILIDAHAVRLDDFDRDGRPDVALAGLGSNGAPVAIARNLGGQSFDALATYPSIHYPLGLATADLTGDGAPDLAIPDAQGAAVHLLANRGDGTFPVRPEYFSGDQTYPLQVELSDLDNDGHLDVFYGCGQATCGWSWHNQGDGGLEHPTVVSDLHWSGSNFALGDVNGDGYPEMVAGGDTWDAALKVYPSLHDGSFGEPVAYPFDQTPADLFRPLLGTPRLLDLNGDGALDVLVSEPNLHVVATYLNLGDGTFGLPTEMAVGDFEYATTMSAGDVDGDGDLDVALMYYHTDPCDGRWCGYTPSVSGVRVYLNDGQGGLVPGAESEPPVTPTSAELVDVNGDTLPDLVTGGMTDGVVGVALNDAHGGFLGRTDYHFETGYLGHTNNLQLPQFVKVGDVSGDGWPDLVAISYVDNLLSVFRNRGDGTFEPAVHYTSGSWPVSLAVGQMDGVGHQDIVVLYYNGNGVSVLSDACLSDTLTDADGDGDPDVTDCQTDNPLVNHSAVDDTCDGVDDNCDDIIDEGCVGIP